MMLCSLMSTGPCTPQAGAVHASTSLHARLAAAPRKRTMRPTVLVVASYLVPGSFTSPWKSSFVSTAGMKSSSMLWFTEKLLDCAADEMPAVESRMKPA